MPKRAKLTCVGDRDDVLRTGGTPLWSEDDKYVRGEWDNSKFGALFVREIERLIQRAELSEGEEQAFRALCMGLTNDEAAEIYNSTPNVIRAQKSCALKKIRRVANIGKLTVIGEISNAISSK